MGMFLRGQSIDLGRSIGSFSFTPGLPSSYSNLIRLPIFGGPPAVGAVGFGIHSCLA